MIGEIILVSIVVIMSIYFGIEYYYKRQLNKLGREYKPEEDVSRRKQNGNSITGSNIPDLSREYVISGNEQLQGRESISIPVSESVTTNQSEPGAVEPELDKGNKLFGAFRRRRKSKSEEIVEPVIEPSTL